MLSLKSGHTTTHHCSPWLLPSPTKDVVKGLEFGSQSGSYIEGVVFLFGKYEPLYIAQVWISCLNHSPIPVFVGDLFSILTKRPYKSSCRNSRSDPKMDLKKKKLTKCLWSQVGSLDVGAGITAIHMLISKENSCKTFPLKSWAFRACVSPLCNNPVLVLQPVKKCCWLWGTIHAALCISKAAPRHGHRERSGSRPRVCCCKKVD